MMLTSSFLSMWLSNTATTAMMLPIANAILESLYGDLQTLKEKCKSINDPEHDIINGTSYPVMQCNVQGRPHRKLQLHNPLFPLSPKKNNP